jgi:hypothetical protein
VKEYIRAIFPGDKTAPFFIIESFDYTGGHVGNLLFYKHFSGV